MRNVKLADRRCRFVIFLTAALVSCDRATRRDAAERRLGVSDTAAGDVRPLLLPRSAAPVLTVDRKLPAVVTG